MRSRRTISWVSGAVLVATVGVSNSGGATVLAQAEQSSPLLFLMQSGGAAGAIDVEASAQEVMIHVGGMADCKLVGVLPMDAINKYGAFLRSIDQAAFLRGSQKAVLMLKGLALKPGTPACAAVRAQLLKNAPTYRMIEESLPD